MRTLMLVSICLSLAVDTWAQKPEPCTSPPLLVGNINLNVPERVAMFQGKFTYDALGQKVRIRAYGQQNNTMETMDQLMFFREGYYYEIHWDKFSCKKKRLDSTFHPMEVPRDATLSAQIILGSSSGNGMGLLVNTWSGTTQGSKPDPYLINYTAFGCLPLSGMYFTAPTAWASWSMYNIIIGLNNPMDLIPPFICEGALLEETAEVDTFFTAVSSLA